MGADRRRTCCTRRRPTRRTRRRVSTRRRWSTPSTVDELKASPQIVGGHARRGRRGRGARCPPMGALTFNPLAGGLPPDLAWESLELFASEVHPRLKAAG